MDEVSTYVASAPLRAGLPREDLRSRLRLEPRAFAAFERRLVNAGHLIARDDALDLPGREPTLSAEQQADVEALLERLQAQGARPESDAAVDPELAEYLESRGQLVRLKGGVLLAQPAYETMVVTTRDLLRNQERATLAEVRDALGTSRKIAQAFLEYLDHERITRRIGDARILREQ